MKEIYMYTSAMKNKRTATKSAECCAERTCGPGLRNNYFDGKRLATQSFRIEQGYGIERRHLLNRAIHGWGVVYGYEITAEPLDNCKKQPQVGKLGIGPGLALDQCGRELLQTGTVAVSRDDLIWLDEAGHQIDPADALPSTAKSRYMGAKAQPPECWLLSAHYAEQYSGPIDVTSSCQCGHREWDRICETVRYSVQRISCDQCCCNFKCELNCECDEEPCDDKGEKTTGSEDSRHNRVSCRCLCNYVTALKFEDDCGPFCEVEEPCGKVQVDFRHGVPLACVEVTWDKLCDLPQLGPTVEACGPRRLVKRNDLLFDLIQGCDLTRISEIGWAQWHRSAGYSTDPVLFKDFRDAFGDIDHRNDEYVTKDFWVKFSRPVRVETLLPDCFAITIMSGERGEGWWETLRVPIRGIDTSVIPSEPGDPAGCVRGARAIVDGAWADDALVGTVTRFQGAGACVEIEIRGDFILDCNGQTVDANAVGLSPNLSGNNTPGGTFLSSFRVAPAEPHHNKGAKS
jgi:hypothetical protein